MTTTSKNPVQWLCEKLAEQKELAKNLPYPEEARYGSMFYDINGIECRNLYVWNALRRISETDGQRMADGFRRAGLELHKPKDLFIGSCPKVLAARIEANGFVPDKNKNRDALDCLIAFLSKTSTPAKKKSKEELERQGRILLKREPSTPVRALAKQLGVNKSRVERLDCWVSRANRNRGGHKGPIKMPARTLDAVGGESVKQAKMRGEHQDELLDAKSKAERQAAALGIEPGNEKKLDDAADQWAAERGVELPDAGA